MEENIKELEEKEKKTDKKSNIRHTIVVYLTIGVATVAFMVFLYTAILINTNIPSESMEQTLMTGDRVIGNRLAYKFGNDPERFDIVIFNAPDEPSKLYIKRIIGMPGDKVVIKDGEVYINDDSNPLNDSFVNGEMDKSENMEFHVPENHYFMLGDNRNESYDSRYWENSYVEKDEIVAKAVFKYWKGLKVLK